MFHSGSMGRDLKRLMILFMLSTILTGAVTYMTGVILKPGASLSEGSRAVICGKMVHHDSKNNQSSSSNAFTGQQNNDDKNKSFWLTIIPPNVFEALSRGSIMGVLFFSILLEFPSDSEDKYGRDHNKYNGFRI
jgi:Na+/H+-dicarboxylate symporter